MTKQPNNDSAQKRCVDLPPAFQGDTNYGLFGEQIESYDYLYFPFLFIFVNLKYFKTTDTFIDNIVKTSKGPIIRLLLAKNLCARKVFCSIV